MTSTSATVSGMRSGDAACALGLVWSDDERSLDAAIMPFSPVRFYLNERLMYRSGPRTR